MLLPVPHCDFKSMPNKYTESESPAISLKNEAARQRWELFHRAIAQAKRSNNAALDEAEVGQTETQGSGPLLSVVR